MIWNDDKIARLMSFGMMHGGRGDDSGSSAGGTGGSSSDGTGDGGGDNDAGNNGGGQGDGDGLSGLGQELSVDLGGGLSIGINSVTGDVTRSGLEDLGEEGRKDFSDFLGRKEAGLAAGQATSDFGNFLSNLTSKQTGGILGAIGGTLLGIGPLAGAVSGARIGGLVGPKDTGLTQTAPGGAPPGTAQAAPGQQQQLAGVPSAGGLAGGLTQSQLGGGDEARSATQLAATGRQSGLAAAPTPVPVNPFLSQRPQLGGQQLLNRSGVLPQVNLNAFPGAIGGIV